MRRFFSFWWLCARKAFWGNTAFANDWQWVFGIPTLSGFAGFLASNKGATDLSTGYPILDGFLTALGAFAVTWTVAFVIRLLNSPVSLFHEQKDRADNLEGLRKLASDVSRSPSFDIGFENIELPPPVRDEDNYDRIRRNMKRKKACLIWIENIDQHPISDCRVVLEDFQPRLPQMVPGAMLLSVNKSDQLADLASSERRYFRLIDFGWGFKVITQATHAHTENGFESILTDIEAPSLPIGKRFFATIVAHGMNAGSRRFNLIIDTITETELTVATSNPTSDSKERAHEQEGK